MKYDDVFSSFLRLYEQSETMFNSRTFCEGKLKLLGILTERSADMKIILNEDTFSRKKSRIPQISIRVIVSYSLKWKTVVTANSSTQPTQSILRDIPKKVKTIYLIRHNILPRIIRKLNKLSRRSGIF